MRRRRILGTVLFLFSGSILVRFWGCSNDGPEAELVRFEDCEELEAYIEDVAVEQLTYTPADVPPIPTPLFLFLGCASYDALSDDDWSGGETSGSEYSTTNLQEVGVDEADFMKNDGQYIYVVHGQDLVIYDVWPAEEMFEVGRLELEGYPWASYLLEEQEMMAVLSFLQDDLLPEGGEATSLRGDVTKITIVDVADRNAPTVLREVYVEGRLTDSRRIEERLYLVTYNDLAQADIDTSVKTKQIKSQIEGRSIDDWLPRRAVNTRSVDTWSLSTSQSCDCADVFRPARDAGLGMTSVLSLDLSDPLSDVVGTSVIAGEAEVYASLDSLYLAVPEPTEGPFHVPDAFEQGTRIHRFDLDGKPDRPVYASSGRVLGEIVNSFAMDEAEGTFRIATTRWHRDELERTNDLYILEELDDRLEVVGEVTELATGEEIYSVRFLDDLAFLVTFPADSLESETDWQWSPPEIDLGGFFDPLFTIDITDPTQPVVLGELEITGYSKYLHPMDEDHLIGIGEEIDPQTNQIIGFQVSLFDISDLTSPQLQDRFVIETGWDSSEALIDHHAFNYYAPHDMLAVPVMVMQGPEGGVTSSVLSVLEITAEDGISVMGTMDADPIIDPTISGEYAAYCNQIRRSVVIEDVLYGVGAGGIIATMVENPEMPIDVLRFPHHGYCDQPWESLGLLW